MASKRSSTRHGSDLMLSDAPSTGIRGGSREALKKGQTKSGVDVPSRKPGSKEQISKQPTTKLAKGEVSRDAPSKDERKKKKEEEEKKRKEEEKMRKEAEKKEKEKKKEEEKKRDEIRKKAKAEMKKQKTLVHANPKLVRSTDGDVAVLKRAKKVETSGVKTNTKRHKTRRHRRGSKERTKGSAENISMVHSRDLRTGESLISARDLTHGDRDMLATNFSALQEALEETKMKQLEALVKKEEADKKLQKKQEKILGKQVEEYKKMIQSRKMVEAELFARSNEIALVYIVALEKEALRIREYPVPRGITDWTKTLASKLIPMMLTFVLTVLVAGLTFSTVSTAMDRAIHAPVTLPFHSKDHYFEVHRVMKEGEPFNVGEEFYTASCPLYEMGEWNFIKTRWNKKTNKTSNVYIRKVILKMEGRNRVPPPLVKKCPPSIAVIDQN